jgi:HEAT repeat protein
MTSTRTRNAPLRSSFALGALLLLPALAGAQAAPIPETREYSRNGEVSPGAAAPSVAGMLSAINTGSPETLKATLEYGERVLCIACVPLLENKLLSSNDARVRELSAWWLRRQPFAGPAVLRQLKKVVLEDADAQRRARAAEALGEFMDFHALEVLTTAARQDREPAVRASAVRGLARLNDPGSGPVIAAALSDAATDVRAAALDSLLLVHGARDFGGLLALLADPEPALRAHAARLCGEVRLSGAETMLTAVLEGDSAASVRKAAAWALGRIGGAAGRAALEAHKSKEADPLVLSAIAVAERMTTRTP